MLRWAVLFLIVAILAGIFGFGGVASTAGTVARILFFIFIALFIATLLFGRHASSTE